MGACGAAETAAEVGARSLVAAEIICTRTYTAGNVAQHLFQRICTSY